MAIICCPNCRTSIEITAAIPLANSHELVIARLEKMQADSWSRVPNVARAINGLRNMLATGQELTLVNVSRQPNLGKRVCELLSKVGVT